MRFRGWHNLETYVIFTEYWDGEPIEDYDGDIVKLSIDLFEVTKELMLEGQNCPARLAILDFLGKVNWKEIAKNRVGIN
jgi:hypothetical protein